MSGNLRDAPLGVRCVEWLGGKCCPSRRIDRMTWHRVGVLGLTYLAYMCYHLSRKPISVVKNALMLNCSGLTPPPDVIVNGSNQYTWCDWAPFGECLRVKLFVGKMWREIVFFFQYWDVICCRYRWARCVCFIGNIGLCISIQLCGCYVS